MLSDVDTLIVNEHEAAALGGLDALLAQVPRVLLTLGAAGAIYADGQGRQPVAAPKVEAVDTTAAGDAFAGAFVVAHSEGRSPVEALRWACAAGALCATRPGASTALPLRAEIDALASAGHNFGGIVASRPR